MIKSKNKSILQDNFRLTMSRTAFLLLIWLRKIKLVNNSFWTIDIYDFPDTYGLFIFLHLIFSFFWRFFIENAFSSVRFVWKTRQAYLIYFRQVLGFIKLSYLLDDFFVLGFLFVLFGLCVVTFLLSDSSYFGGVVLFYENRGVLLVDWLRLAFFYVLVLRELLDWVDAPGLLLVEVGEVGEVQELIEPLGDWPDVVELFSDAVHLRWVWGTNNKPPVPRQSCP